jgi:hypothetical protein
MKQAAAEARFDLAASRLKLALLENRYRPDQPRVPAGNSDGGQWIAVGSSGAATANEMLVAQALDAITKHAVNQLITRGVSPGDILDALRNPIRIRRRSNMTTQYVGKHAAVVLNDYGGMVTIWDR